MDIDDERFKERITLKGLISRLEEQSLIPKIKEYELDGETQKSVYWKTEIHECFLYFSEHGSFLGYDLKVMGPFGYHWLSAWGEYDEFERVVESLGL